MTYIIHNIRSPVLTIYIYKNLYEPGCGIGVPLGVGAAGDPKIHLTAFPKSFKIVPHWYSGPHAFFAALHASKNIEY